MCARRVLCFSFMSSVACDHDATRFIDENNYKIFITNCKRHESCCVLHFLLLRLLGALNLIDLGRFYKIFN